MNKKPERFTGECPVCHRRLGVNDEGVMNVHKGTVHYNRGGTRPCWGTRRLAVEGTVQLDDSVVPAYKLMWGL